MLGNNSAPFSLARIRFISVIHRRFQFRDYHNVVWRQKNEETRISITTLPPIGPKFRMHFYQHKKGCFKPQAFTLILL